MSDKMFSELTWLENTNCLVTGGAGFIGSHVATTLLNLGAKVTILDDLSTGSKENLKFCKNAEFVEGSILDQVLLGKVTKGVDYIFHLAAIPAVPRSIQNPIETTHVNSMGTVYLLESARQNKVKRLVFSSSSSLYGGITSREARKEDVCLQPLSPYAAQKLSSEAMCTVYGKTMGLQTVSLRYFNIFGPRQNPHSEYSAVIPKFIHLILNGKPLQIHGDGFQSRDFTYVSNAVLANLLATNPKKQFNGEVFNVGCGKNFSLNDLVRMLTEIAKLPVQVNNVDARAGDVYFSCADVSKIKTTLGYDAVVSFEQGLALTFESIMTGVA